MGCAVVRATPGEQQHARSRLSVPPPPRARWCSSVAAIDTTTLALSLTLASFPDCCHQLAQLHSSLNRNTRPDMRATEEQLEVAHDALASGCCDDATMNVDDPTTTRADDTSAATPTATPTASSDTTPTGNLEFIDESHKMEIKSGKQASETSSTNHVMASNDNVILNESTVSVESCWRLDNEAISRPRILQFVNDPRLPPIPLDEPRPLCSSRHSFDMATRTPAPLRLPSIASPPPIRQHQRRHTTSDLSGTNRAAPQLPRIDDSGRSRLRRDVLRKSLSCNDSWLSAGPEDERGTTLPPISEADAACEMADSLLQPRQRHHSLMARPTSLLSPQGDIRRQFRRNQMSPPSAAIALQQRDRSPLTPRHTRLAALRLPVIEEDAVLPDALLSRPRRRVLRRAGPALDHDDSLDVDMSLGNERSANGAALHEAQVELGARLFVDSMTERMLLQERGASGYGPALCRGVRGSMLTFDATSPLLVSLVPTGRLAPILASTTTSGQKRSAELN